MGMSDDLDLDLADPAAGGEPPRHVRLGLLGCGNVGAALVALIERDRDEIATRTGVLLDVTRVAVRSLSKERGLALPDGVLTTDGASVATDPDVDVVVEVLGGIEPARGYITAALHAAKPVVTANKELLANVGGELAEVAEGAGVDLLFEAAVAGAIPLIRPLRESLVGERITRVMGIVNGTTNFILTQMAERGTGYAEALAEAQSLGFAERDPTADVEGYDAGAKAARIATSAFGSPGVAGDVYHEGISNIGAADIAYAEQMGYRIKLLAICETFDDDSVAVRVHPTMVPVGHPLAAVSGSFNAVFVEGASVGERGARRRQRRGSEPRQAHACVDRFDRAVPNPADRRVVLGVLREPGGLRRARRVGSGRRRVRWSRGVDPVDGAGGPRRSGTPRVHHPRGFRVGRSGDAQRAVGASGGATGQLGAPRHRA